MGQIALVVGATGLVGGLVVKELLQQEEIVEVRALVRRPFEMTHPKLKVMQIDWDRLEMYTAFLRMFIVCTAASERRLSKRVLRSSSARWIWTMS